jgi:uncharacterized membrane protein YgaE (UPF0421/DUF939 family)
MMVFILSWLFDYREISWAIISTMLVISPDSREAPHLALTRIKANIIGGLASLLFLVILPPGLIAICLALSFTILSCFFLKIMPGSKSAVAAVIIIMLHGMDGEQSHFWETTLLRVLSVIAGCVIGLLITYLFHWKVHFGKSEGGEESGEG